jgi:hypothetical protein
MFQTGIIFVQNKAKFFSQKVLQKTCKKRGAEFWTLSYNDKPTFFPIITNFTLL